MKEKFAGATRPSESSERNAERLKEDVRGILSRTAQELLAKGRTGFEARRAKGELFELRLKEIPPAIPVPESPKLDELRLDAEIALSIPETPTTEEAVMLLQRGLIAMAWDGIGLDLNEICLVLKDREGTKTRSEWISKAVQSLTEKKPKLAVRSMPREEAEANVALLVDGTIAAHKRSRL